MQLLPIWLNWLALEQKTVTAPCAGEIFDTFFKIGEFVPAGQSVTALLTPNNIKLIFYIPEPLLSQLKLGTIVNFNAMDVINSKLLSPTFHRKPNIHHPLFIAKKAEPN